MGGRFVFGVFAVGVLGFVSAVNAEVPWPTVSRVPQSSTSVRLTLDPWADNSYLQSDSVMFIEEQGHLHGGADGEAQHIFFSDFWGRARAVKKQNSEAGWENTNQFLNPAIGFRWTAIDFGVHRAGLPSQMQDVSLAAGVLFSPQSFGAVSVVAGAGYAGNSPFNDGSAAYGIAHVADSWVLDSESKFVASLDYDGNRGFMPDVPLPGFAYVHESVKDRYRLWIGFPETSLVWRPTDQLMLEFGWGFPETIGFRVTYEIVPGISLYGAADNFFGGFHYSSQANDQRMFFQQRRAEVGVRFMMGKWLDLSVGGGYAWDQKLQSGFDSRDLNGVTRFDDGAYLMMRLGGSF